MKKMRCWSSRKVDAAKVEIVKILLEGGLFDYRVYQLLQ
jgi:hypothetical protein